MPFQFNHSQNSTVPRYRGGTRLLKWLIKRDAEAGLALHAYGKISPAAAANDNEPSPMSWIDGQERDDVEPTGSGRQELHAEYLHEIKPSTDSMVSEAYRTWATNTVQRKRELKNSKPFTWRALQYREQPHVNGYITRIGNMLFNSNPLRTGEGLMTEYERNKRGDPVAPKVECHKPRGGKRAKRIVNVPNADHTARKAGYLDLRGTALNPRHVNERPVLPDMLDRTEDCAAAVVELSKWKDQVASFPVTRCPTGIAKNAKWIGGVVGTKQTASKAAIPESHKIDKPELPNDITETLEYALSGETFSDLGARLGYKGRYADKAGKRAFLNAIDTLVAANNNGRLKENAA
ncbi:hypothetical protein HB779_06130 [Phyllobacterium sp. 628]|uniref:hypothetical protein n=1 Tax=Phyllobacterium sp. 628 TaxID=2718938 RepID=UPI0016626F31|nr:hypothetical protein [Phyllobacterium sp. 628]QND51525.1 hypothetical protein HB779_06130 [Phyllobacterium sp. 628]